MPLVQVFQYFGGVPRRVIFDNGKVAVKDGFGAHARKQAGYAALAAHYGFEAIFCNPASGNEKGLVEGLVGYSRRNTCVPVPRVDSMEELNALFQEKCRQVFVPPDPGQGSQRGVHAGAGKGVSLPASKEYPFDPCKRSTGRVDRFCTIRFDSNNYSVPCELCGREVSVKASPETVSIYLGGTCIAQHTTVFGTEKDHLRFGALFVSAGKEGPGNLLCQTGTGNDSGVLPPLAPQPGSHSQGTGRYPPPLPGKRTTWKSCRKHQTILIL